MSHNTIRPKQTIPLSTKLSKGKEGKKWREENVDYYSQINSNQILSRAEFDELYQIAEGHLNKTDYNYVTNPVQSNNGETLLYPAKLRNYDIVSPIIQLLLGEKIKRTLKPIVFAANSDITTIKEQEERQLIQSQLDQIIINGLNDLGLDTGFASRDLATKEEILKNVDSVKDSKAMMGQESLNYILQYNDVMRQLRKCWFDFCVTGYCSSYKDVIYNNTYYEAIEPANVMFIASETTDFIEDGEAACIKMYMTTSQVIDLYHEELDEKDLEKIENIHNIELNANRHYSNVLKDDIDSYTNSYNNLTNHNEPIKSFSDNSFMIEISYVNWKSLVKVGKVTSIDFAGNSIEYEVEEGFKPRPDETIEWKWVNQVWEGVKIELNGGNDPIYLRIRPISTQRAQFDNPSSCKLLINGRNLFSRRFSAKSIVEKLRPYQELVNILYWQLEKTINKNMDKLVVIPSDLVPDNKDLTMEDMIYYAKADGFLFLEGNLTGKQVNQLNAIKSIDLSLSQYISYLKDLIYTTKAEAEELIGINRQRKGNVNSSDGKGTTEQAIFQSSIMTEALFTEFEEFEKREYQGLLDLSKFAWIDGKKAMYVNSDKKTAFLNVQGYEHAESEYGIFAGNSSEEKENKNLIKSRSVEFLQNGMKPSVLTKLLNSDNLEEMIDIIEIDELRIMEQSQQAQQAELEAMAKETAFKEREHVDKIQLEYDKLASNFEIELLKVENVLRSASTTTENPDQSIKFTEMANKAMIEREKLSVKREELASKERMNKQNNETALKNKVVGESSKR